MKLEKELMEIEAIQPLICIRLNELRTGQTAVITKTPDHDLLAPLGLRTGKKIMIESRQPFEGPLMLCIGDRKIAVSRHFANDIIVQK